jgi:hypothetical protein
MQALAGFCPIESAADGIRYDNKNGSSQRQFPKRPSTWNQSNNNK